MAVHFGLSWRGLKISLQRRFGRYANIRKGQRYVAIRDVEDVLCVTHWRAPFTGGYRVIFPKGEAVVLPDDFAPGATGVACLPERYDHFLAAFIPESDRTASKFTGYHLTIYFDTFANAFQILPDRHD